MILNRMSLVSLIGSFIKYIINQLFVLLKPYGHDMVPIFVWTSKDLHQLIAPQLAESRVSKRKASNEGKKAKMKAKVGQTPSQQPIAQ